MNSQPLCAGAERCIFAVKVVVQLNTFQLQAVEVMKLADAMRLNRAAAGEIAPAVQPARFTNKLFPVSVFNWDQSMLWRESKFLILFILARPFSALFQPGSRL